MADADDTLSAPQARGRSRLGKLLPLLAIGALAVLVIAMGWHRLLSLEFLLRRRAELEAFVTGHFAAALLAYIGFYVAAVALSVPGAVFLTIAGGVLFGWLIGGAAAVIGATLGSSLVFLIVRGAFADIVRRRFGPRIGKVTDSFRADAFSYLLFLRLVPVFPFWLVNLAAAVAGVGLAAFLVATGIGIIPATFAFATFGAGLDSVLGAQEAAYKACLAAARADCRLDFDVRAAMTPKLFAALCALGAAALIPVAIRRWRGSKNA